MRLVLWLCAALWLCVAVLACGGNTSGESTGEGALGGDELCWAYCTSRSECRTNPSDCSYCDDYSPDSYCLETVTELKNCLLDGWKNSDEGQCFVPEACNEVKRLEFQCFSPHIEDWCGSTEDGCSCHADVLDDTWYEARCTPQGNQTQCECFRGDEVEETHVGTCVEPEPIEDACGNINTSCCAVVLVI